MNFLNPTDYSRAPLLSALIVAPAALALIVVLLWFGSTRNSDPVSADEARLYSECLEGAVAPCEDATLKVRPLGDGTGELSGVQDLGTSPGSDSAQDNQRCLLPGIPCSHDPDLGYIGQSVGVQATQELRTY